MISRCQSFALQRGSAGDTGTGVGRCWPLLILVTKELGFYICIRLGDKALSPCQKRSETKTPEQSVSSVKRQMVKKKKKLSRDVSFLALVGKTKMKSLLRNHDSRPSLAQI